MINRYFSIANFLLITVGVYLCVNAFYTVVTGQLDFGTPGNLPLNRSPEASIQRSYPPLAGYSAIAKRNIFNTGSAKSEGPAAEPKVDIENLKETDLKLKLWGTVTGRDEAAYAVIEDTKARQQNLYRAGDTIQDAVVKLILREKVVLRVEDRDEILAMEDNRASAAGRSAGRNVNTVSSTSTQRLPVSSYQRKIRLSGNQIQQAMENLGELMQQATLRPHIEDGQPAGISITGIKPNAIFRKMRLRNGDIITGVNGNSIDSVEDAMKVVDQLSSGSGIQLQIKRRGREQTLDYSIE